MDTRLRTWRTFALAITLTLAAGAGTFAATPQRPAAPSAARPAPRPTRDVSTLPVATAFARSGHGAFAVTEASPDTFLILSNGFDDHSGDCQPRGWTGQDRAGLVLSNVSGAAVVNRDIVGAFAASSSLSLPAPLASTNLIWPQAATMDAAGDLVFYDSGLGLPMVVDRGAGELRQLGDLIPGNLPWSSAALDPVTGRIVVAAKTATEGSQLWAYPAGGGTPVRILGGGTVQDDTTAAAAYLLPIEQIAIDAAGNIFITEPVESRVRMLRANDQRVVTIVGNGYGSDGDGGLANLATVRYPTGVAIEPGSGRLWIADPVSNAVRVVTDPLLPTATIDTYTSLVEPTYLVLSAGRLFAVVNQSELQIAWTFELLPGGGTNHSLGTAVSMYSAPAQSDDATQQILYRQGTPAADGAGGYYVPERTARLVYHVTSGGRLEVGAGHTYGIHMGLYALRVGADMGSNPNEVSDWVYPEGDGSNWSQRLVSPAVHLGSTVDPVLEFDAALEVDRSSRHGTLHTNSFNELMAVQAQRPDGTWGTLSTRFIDPFAGFDFPGANSLDVISGRGLFKFQTSLSSAALLGIGAASDTRLRIVVQTLPNGTSEDGLSGPIKAAAVIDNIRLVDGATTLLSQDFESGTLGAWTLAAQNAISTPPGVFPFYIRDDVAPTATVAPRSGFDFTDPSCVWAFTAAGDTVPNGLNARLVSPWVARANPADSIGFVFSGKFPTRDQARYATIWARGKNAGDTHPRWATPSFFNLNSGNLAGDLAVPFVTDRATVLPQDFLDLGIPMSSDSVQFFIEVQDNLEQAMSLHPIPPLRTSKLPIFDDLRIFQKDQDRDHDGICDLRDGCPDDAATGQDAETDGCVDPTATFRHLESWDPTRIPLRYSLSQHVAPGITDGSDRTAINAAFGAWVDVAGGAFTVVDDGQVLQTDSDALDGVNLITFEDAGFQLPPDVVAVTPTLSFTRQGVFDDRVVKPGEILDADLIVNPSIPLKTATQGPTNGIDLQSVMTHEIGHLLGLNHSGVIDASMFFVIQSGTLGRTLTDDDRAALASAYPAGDFDTRFGAITGQVTFGTDGHAVPGALVTAVRLAGLAPVDSAASDYTREDGTFALRGLTSGDYAVRVTPLDGDMDGWPMTPDRIGPRIESIARTDFQAEWFSDPETDRDDPALLLPITVGAGSAVGGLHVVTNIDTIAPMVVTVSPPADSTGLHIDTSVLLSFSERIDATSLQTAFRLHPLGADSSRLGGNGVLLGLGRSFVFTPSAALDFDTQYVLELTTDLKDREGVHMLSPFITTFRTEVRPPVALTAIQPSSAPRGALVTLLGTDFDRNPANNLVHLFAPPIDTAVVALNATPTSLVFRVPPDANSGDLYVEVSGQMSNTLTFNVLPAQPLPVPNRIMPDLALSFAPTDVAVSPDGNTVFAVGDGGMAVVNLDANMPLFQQADYRAIGAARAIVLTPDGFTGVVTRPSTHDVALVDTDPSSGTFGLVRAVVPILAEAGDTQPDGVTVSPDGRRAYVNELTSRTIVEIDIDRNSSTREQVVGRRSTGGATTTGGLAVTPDGQSLFAGTFDRGVLTTAAPDSMQPLLSVDGARGVAVTPDGGQAVFTTGPTPANQGVLVQTALNDPVGHGVMLGGMLSAVVIVPQGPTAFATNSTYNSLQVVSLDPGSPAFRTKIAEVTTGTSPQAVATSAYGGVVAVANHGSHDLSLFRPGTPLGAINQMSTDVAMPGEVVGIAGSGDNWTGTVQAKFGSTLVDPPVIGAAYAFPQVPALSQRTTDLTVLSDAGPSQTVLFRIVDPLPLGPPATTGIRDTVVVECFGGITTAPQDYQHLVMSQDGRILAAGHYASSCSPLAGGGYVDIFRTSSDTPQPFGQRLGTIHATAIPDNIRGMAISSDGRYLWTADDLNMTRVFDIDPASPTFLQLLALPPLGLTGDITCIAADPLRKQMVLGSQLDQEIVYWTTDGGSQINFPTSLGDDARTLAFSHDGRMLLVGGTGKAFLFDAYSGALLSTSPSHLTSGGYADRVRSIAMTRDGRFAAGLYAANNLAVWSLDPNIAPLGTEVYFGPFLPLAGVTASELIPGTDLTSLRIFAAGQLWRVDLAIPVPVTTPVPLAIPNASKIVSSPDGRQLWTAYPGIDGLGRNYGAVELYSAASATSLTAVAGVDQSGLAGSDLPMPVVVRLTDAAARPVAGVVLHFGVAEGLLDGRSTFMRKTTDSDGQATVLWRLGSTPGPATLSVHAFGTGAAGLSIAASVALDDASIAPVILSFGPADGASGLGAATPVAVRFNQRMDSLTTTQRMQLTANGNPVAGRFRLEDGGRFVIFTPAALLPYSATCVLGVAAGAQDTDGQALAAGGTSTFTVQTPPSLAVNSITPPAAPEGAPVMLSGDGFSAVSAQNTVLVNGRRATVSEASATSLLIHVPIGATTGPLTVQVGPTVSDPMNLVVTSGSGVGGTIATVATDPGASRVAITPDGQRALVINGQTNTLTFLDLVQLQTITSVTVGLSPSGVVVLPNDSKGARAYVANSGSNDVSVVDIAEGSATQYQVVGTIKVGSQPSGIAVSSLGPQVLVVNSGSNTVSIIDANSSNGTFDAVTASVNVGSSGQQITVMPDGGRAFVGTSDGHVVVIDLNSHAVIASVNVGTSTQSITVTPDGGMVLALLTNGMLVAIDVRPGSAHENQVVASVNVGTSTQSITVTPDGGTVFVTSSDNTVIVVEIGQAPTSGASSYLPTTAVTLTITQVIPVGDAPLGLAVDPSGSGLLLVVNSGSGTITVIGSPTQAPTVDVEFDFNPNTLNLKSLGRWVNARIEPPAPWRPEQIRLKSVRLNGVVPIDSAAHVTFGDGDCDGVRDVTVKFSRAAAELAVSAGDTVPVVCTGILDSTEVRGLVGRDTIKVLRGRVTAPVAHETLAPGAHYTVRWTSPKGHESDDGAQPAGSKPAQSVTLLHSTDGGVHWIVDLAGLPDNGSAAWTAPAASCDSALVALIFVLEGDGSSPLVAGDEVASDVVSGVLAVSDGFRVAGVTAVEVAPTVLQFAPVRPNPAHGAALLRFGIPSTTPVRLEVFDIAGRRVRTLVDGVREPGWYEARWIGDNESRSRIGAGLYFVRLKAVDRTLQQRLVWIP